MLLRCKPRWISYNSPTAELALLFTVIEGLVISKTSNMIETWKEIRFYGFQKTVESEGLIKAEKKNPKEHNLALIPWKNVKFTNYGEKFSFCYIDVANKIRHSPDKYQLHFTKIPSIPFNISTNIVFP